MTESTASTGYFSTGLPFNRSGHGPRPIVVFDGLGFENKPQSRWMPRFYSFLEDDYTVWIVQRKPGLPSGYTLQDMADDYAATIRQEFGGPVDVIGLSTGGSIVQHFAAGHPDLVRRLVIHSSAYVLSDEARRLQMRVARLAAERRWAEAFAVFLEPMTPRPARPLLRLIGPLLAAFGAPKDPLDLVVTVEAEDCHNFKGRLSEITMPTLVVAGDRDPFYTPELFRATAEGIPDARLLLYEGMGHPAAGHQFARDVLAFLKGQTPGLS